MSILQTGKIKTGDQSSLINRNIRVSGHRTSMRLEEPMWNALEEIANRENYSIHTLCTMVDQRRSESSLTAAVRVFILSYFRAASTNIGHLRAGHGVRDEDAPSPPHIHPVISPSQAPHLGQGRRS